MTDADLLYNQNKVRIYLGKDKKSCIRYGNGYRFCISARGDGNAYSIYRMEMDGTPYFIFNDNLPSTDNRHLMVLIVYDDAQNGKSHRYSLTLASNEPEDEKYYKSIKQIINDYPWTKPLENFINDEDKGTVEPDALEVLEHYLYVEFESEYNRIAFSSIDMPKEQIHAIDFLHKDNSILKNYQKIQKSLKDGNNLIFMYIKRLFQKDDAIETWDNSFDNYNNIGELMNKIQKTASSLKEDKNEPDREGLKEFIESKKTVINTVFTGETEKLSLIYPEYTDGKPDYELDTFIITLYSKNWFNSFMSDEDNSSIINTAIDLEKRYNQDLNWLRQKTPEQLKIVLDSWKEKIDGVSKIIQMEKERI